MAGSTVFRENGMSAASAARKRGAASVEGSETAVPPGKSTSGEAMEDTPTGPPDPPAAPAVVPVPAVARMEPIAPAASAEPPSTVTTSAELSASIGTLRTQLELQKAQEGRNAHEIWLAWYQMLPLIKNMRESVQPGNTEDYRAWLTAESDIITWVYDNVKDDKAHLDMLNRALSNRLFFVEQVANARKLHWATALMTPATSALASSARVKAGIGEVGDDDNVFSFPTVQAELGTK